MNEREMLTLPMWQRLTDDAPNVRDDTQFSSELTLAQFKQDVVDNIALILNSRTHLSLLELKCDRQLQHSVLGFGLADICGMSYNPKRLHQIEERIRQQLIFFEPRLNPDSIKVELIKEDYGNGIYALAVSGELNIYHYHNEMMCVLSVDFETGTIELK